MQMPWTKVWNQIIKDKTLSDKDFRIWCFIKMYSNGKDLGEVAISEKQITDHLGIHRSTFYRSISRLTQKGYMENRTTDKGPIRLPKPVIACRTDATDCRVHATPCRVHATETCRTDATLQRNINTKKEKSIYREGCTSTEVGTTTISTNVPTVEKPTLKKIKSKSVAKEKEKPQSPWRVIQPCTEGEAEAAMDQIPLSEFENKHPEINIPEEFTKFKNYHLSRVVKGKPYYQLHSNFKSCFSTWCLNAGKFSPGVTTTQEKRLSWGEQVNVEWEKTKAEFLARHAKRKEQA